MDGWFTLLLFYFVVAEVLLCYVKLLSGLVLSLRLLQLLQDTGYRIQDTGIGNREQGTGNREQETDDKSVKLRVCTHTYTHTYLLHAAVHRAAGTLSLPSRR